MKLVQWGGRILSYLVLLLAVFAALLLIVIPLVTGSQTYTVLTGSMQPGYPPGSLVVVKPEASEQLAIGDVITYQLTPGQPEVVTHRITGVGTTQNGERTFATQGDANSTPDDRSVLPVQIRGKLFYSVPLLGYPASWLNQGFDQVGGKGPIILLVVVGLFGYGFWMFFQTWRERRKAKLADSGSAELDPANSDSAEELPTEESRDELGLLEPAPAETETETRRMHHAAKG